MIEHNDYLTKRRISGELKESNLLKLTMTPEKQKELNQHLQAIAEILYEEADETQLSNLAEIEKTIRGQTLEYITPELGVFFSKRRQEHHQEEPEK